MVFFDLKPRHLFRILPAKPAAIAFIAAVFCSSFVSGFDANLPTGASVVSGQVGLATSGQAMTITQGSAKAIVNFDGFSIGSGYSVNVSQPSAVAAMLARVTGQDPSQIMGSLTANGAFYLVNPNGVFFGKNAQVDVNKLIASTLNISDANFLAGKDSFEANGAAGDVVNEGTINANMVALLGQNVTNAGNIHAQQIAIAAATQIDLGYIAGGKMTVDLSGIMGDVKDRGKIAGDLIVIKGDRIGLCGEITATEIEVDPEAISKAEPFVISLAADGVISGAGVLSPAPTDNLITIEAPGSLTMSNATLLATLNVNASDPGLSLTIGVDSGVNIHYTGDSLMTTSPLTTGGQLVVNTGASTLSLGITPLTINNASSLTITGAGTIPTGDRKAETAGETGSIMIYGPYNRNTICNPPAIKLSHAFEVPACLQDETRAVIRTGREVLFSQPPSSCPWIKMPEVGTFQPAALNIELIRNLSAIFAQTTQPMAR